MKKLLSILFIASFIVSCSSKGGDEVVALSDENNILAFTFNVNNQIVNGDIDETFRRINFDLRGADITSLIPSISIPAGATVNPGSGFSQDFSSPKVYTVTAENGDTRSYTVTVVNTPFSTEKDITSFKAIIGGAEYFGAIEEQQGAIFLNPGNVDLTSLTIEMEISEYATVDPANGTSQNMEGLRTFTVTAEDGSTKEYQVYTNEPGLFGISGFGGQGTDVRLFYSGGEMRIDGDNMSYSFGEKLVISDGTNEYDLEILSTQQGSNGMNGFVSEVRIPSNVPTGIYNLLYQRGAYIVDLAVDFDIDGDNVPVVTSTNQTSYNYNDQMIITGQNLTPSIVIPSNGSQYIINPPSSTYNYMLSPDRTTITLDLGNFQLFPSYYGNSPEVKKILLIGENGRDGISFEVTFN